MKETAQSQARRIYSIKTNSIKRERGKVGFGDGIKDGGRVEVQSGNAMGRTRNRSHMRWESLFYEQRMARGLEKWKKDGWREEFWGIKTEEKEG